MKQVLIEFTLWAILFCGSAFIVSLFGGSEMLQGTIGAIIAIRYTDKIFNPLQANQE